MAIQSTINFPIYPKKESDFNLEAEITAELYDFDDLNSAEVIVMLVDQSPVNLQDVLSGEFYVADFGMVSINKETVDRIAHSAALVKHMVKVGAELDNKYFS